MKTWLRKKVPGFTLVEMLVVLLIISVLLIVFLPEVRGHFDNIEKTGDQAIVSLVSAEQELCYLTKGEHKVEELAGITDPKSITAEMLFEHNHIDEKQLKRYQQVKGD